MKIQCQKCGSEIKVEIIGTAEAARICGLSSVHGIIKPITRSDPPLLDAVKIGGKGRSGKWAMLRREAERYRDERRSVGRPKRKPPAPVGGLNRSKKEKGND